MYDGTRADPLSVEESCVLAEFLSPSTCIVVDDPLLLNGAVDVSEACSDNVDVVVNVIGACSDDVDVAVGVS